jgi:hypothetical protein
VRIVVQDFIDLPVVERCVKPAREPLGAAPGAAAGEMRNRPERGLDASGREPDRTGELSVEEEKLGVALRSEVGRVAAAIRFERRTRAQQSDPFEVIGRQRRSARKVEIDDRRGLRGAFEEAAHLEILPPRVGVARKKRRFCRTSRFFAHGTADYASIRATVPAGVHRRNSAPTSASITA